MHVTRTAVCICVLLCGALAGKVIPTRNGSGAKGKHMEITESWNGRTIRLTVGQKFTIKLNETPGTGYRWHFVHNGAPAVSLVDDSFRAGTQRPGAGGIREFLLKAVSPGETTIEMNLSRPWDASSVMRSLLLNLIVT
jgi:predicted secreted protein